jgi:hypothetical protein
MWLNALVLVFYMLHMLALFILLFAQENKERSIIGELDILLCVFFYNFGVWSKSTDSFIFFC